MEKFKLMIFFAPVVLFSSLHSDYARNNQNQKNYSNKQYYHQNNAVPKKRQIAQNLEYDSEPERIYPVERGSSSDTTPESVEYQSRGYPANSDKHLQPSYSPQN